ncbi:fungal specific transcription factor domain-containing protein [Aspergillus undulatus]|uniref:fungal specific transcription factor domain-containing protein n=1 Tax=Aspergillus undulatus TaxID=1810928 RepID=UPI003CCD6D8E
MKSTIRRLEEQLARATQTPAASPRSPVSSKIETTTSGIAGTFHVNHESRPDANSHAVSRNLVIHKSRLFGSSHWAQAASMFRDIFETIEPYIREKGSKAVSGIKRCKDLARLIKSQRTPQWPTPPTPDLPPKGVADELVDCYLRTMETTFRVLHIPTFKTEYDALWVSDSKPSTAFTVQLKLVLAIGAITYDDRFSLRASAIRWVYEAHTWLSDPDFKPRLNIQSLQSRVLLLISREAINVGGDSSWISAGALLRTALYMGLHRDPSHLPNRTALAAEMRRRLWNTILELSLQASILSGGMPLISLSDFDCEAPGNFDDEQLLAEDPVPKADHEYTQTSIARELRKTYPQRLAIAIFLNNLDSYGTYEGTVRLDAELRTSYRGICRTLRGYSSRPDPAPSYFETRVLDFIIHYYLCCLHMPFFERSLREAAFAFSRKVVIESSLRVWCAIYPSSNIMAAARQHETSVDQEWMTRFVTSGFGFFRTGTMLAPMFASLELKAQLQDEDSLGPSPYRLDLFSLLSDAKVRAWAMIECGETNVKGYLLSCLVNAQVEALMQGIHPNKVPEHLVQAAEAAEEKCIAFMEEKASQSYNGLSIDTVVDPSANTAPFMGDWEFLMSDAFFSLGNVEPMTWLLNDESRPFMM